MKIRARYAGLLAGGLLFALLFISGFEKSPAPVTVSPLAGVKTIGPARFPAHRPTILINTMELPARPMQMFTPPSDPIGPRAVGSVDLIDFRYRPDIKLEFKK